MTLCGNALQHYVDGVVHNLILTVKAWGCVGTNASSSDWIEQWSQSWPASFAFGGDGCDCTAVQLSQPGQIDKNSNIFVWKPRVTDRNRLPDKTQIWQQKSAHSDNTADQADTFIGPEQHVCYVLEQQEADSHTTAVDRNVSSHAVHHDHGSQLPQLRLMALMKCRPHLSCMHMAHMTASKHCSGTRNSSK